MSMTVATKLKGTVCLDLDTSERQNGLKAGFGSFQRNNKEISGELLQLQC